MPEADGPLFLSMEYVDGEDLGSLLCRIGRLPSDKALEIARGLCAGLAAAHEKGVLHLDLKPANITLDGRGHGRRTWRLSRSRANRSPCEAIFTCWALFSMSCSPEDSPLKPLVWPSS